MNRPLLVVEDLTRAFGGLVAVNALSFSIEPGEIVALVGPNGSGKTTALNLISGALAADRGSILFRGQELCALPAHRIARLGIARTFQLARVLDGMACNENVEAGLAFHPAGAVGRSARGRAEQLLDRIGLSGKGFVQADELNAIDRKRLELARALALSPSLLLLDEWLAGLNPTELAAGIALVRSLADEGITLILVEHVMYAVHSLCRRCIVLNAGRKIADGPTAAVLEDAEVVRAYLGDEDDAATVEAHARA
ncbi:MAG TPA: ATP-binding cassette domain-containing protein [Casimicrobiaceae bacterium]|nr:ATP-binding cassette domain-containing protein [Casimicrobiaceae bacterium]